MTPLLFALYAAGLLLEGMADMTALKQSSSLRFKSVSVGEEVTMECFCDRTAYILYWYKQTLGQTPKVVSSFYMYSKSVTLKGEFKDPRFKVFTTSDKTYLKISGVQISDSGTYYCINSNDYDFTFLGGSTIHVKGSGLKIPALVHQSASETIQPGGSVTLNCTVNNGTCDGEHSVYWFKSSEESHPGLIYTHGGMTDQCERESNTQTHTCVYNLPITSLSASHAGTYYCAVVSCGHVLFGDGTKLDFQVEVDSLVLVHVLSGALAFTTILSVLLAYTAYTLYRRNSSQCTDSQARSSANPAPNVEGYQDADNLHYAAIRMNQAKRSSRQRNDNLDECVYSSVRQ